MFLISFLKRVFFFNFFFINKLNSPSKDLCALKIQQKGRIYMIFGYIEHILNMIYV